MERETRRNRHWADETAERILAAGRPPVISTGISPSGEIHIGNLREVLTGDAVYRALRDVGAEVRFNYVCDNYDPLRKVYPFLDRSRYERWVGQPIFRIPCPCGKHASYADHFLEPFLESLRRLRIEVEVEHADRLYESGRMTPYVVRALEDRDRIAAILEEMTGKPMVAEWSPFNPLCPACGRVDRAGVTGFSPEEETVSYRCACGSTGTIPITGGGKLTWRVDWPARWMALGVTVEPFGKDHGTRGGSYDTGRRIVREIFGGQAPFPIPYEWISLKGKGDMSSSKGNVLSISRMLEVVPPEVLRYLVLKEKPGRAIRFDPGVPLLQLVDEVDDLSAPGRSERAIELSRAGGFEPVGVPFKHLVVVAQVASFDVDRTLAILERNGYTDLSREAVAERIGYARRWLESFAPDDLRFRVRGELPPEASSLSREQRVFLSRLADALREDMSGEQVHELIYRLAGAFSELRPAELFQAIYLTLLGRPRGPRAGWFIALLGPAFCAQRFHEAAEPRTD